MTRIPDPPEIRRTERTGYPKREPEPVCPVCGESFSRLFADCYGNIFACDACVIITDREEITD